MQLSKYGSLRAILYDIGEHRHAQRDFYLSQYHQDLGHALEPMCGTGFFITHFLQNGVRIDGVDVSSDMLARCREKCEGLQPQPTLFQQRLEELELPKLYGFVFIPDGSFSHLYEKSVAEQALARLYAHMAPGGKLLVDLHLNFEEPWEVNRWIGYWHEHEDGSTILVSTLARYEEHSRVFKCVSKYELFINGAPSQTELNTYAVRFYDPVEFVQMLEAAGFKGVRNLPTEWGESDSISGIFECYKLG